MAAEPLGDARDVNVGFTEAGEHTTFVEREMGEGAGHAMPPRAVSSQK
jgi:hypothetical protein